MKTVGLILAGLVLAAVSAFAGPYDIVNGGADGFDVRGLKIHGAFTQDGTNITGAQIVNAATVAGGGTVAASTLTGNIAAGRITNATVSAAANTVNGAAVFGNVPLASTTNALNTVTVLRAGVLAGNAPIAVLTNALHTTGLSCVVTGVVFNAGATTGNFTFVDGLLTAQP